MSWVTGVGLTRFGKLEGWDTLALMSDAAAQALADAQLERRDIDGLLCGYSTSMPHLMLSTAFAEHFGLAPAYAHAMLVGGATGFAMAALAHQLVESGVACNVLAVAGENRMTGSSRDSAIQTLAQVGHPVYEVPLGATIPSYYALVASRYMYEYAVSEPDLAELAVVMRRHAGMHPGAQFRDPVTVEQVLASKPIASPLKLLDCCPLSDGGAAFIVSRNRTNSFAVRIIGTGQAHGPQHVSALRSVSSFGARAAAERALSAAGVSLADIRFAAIYDSFTITLTILLEEIGLCTRGQAGERARGGYFNHDGRLPLNTHGGLLSYGHSGAAGALAHLVETHYQMTGRAQARQVRDPVLALLHGDGGVLSSHVSLVLEVAR
jgi:acetyl-CoA acetyltransferase